MLCPLWNSAKEKNLGVWYALTLKNGSHLEQLLQLQAVLFKRFEGDRCHAFPPNRMGKDLEDRRDKLVNGQFEDVNRRKYWRTFEKVLIIQN